ncbi:uncharacterized protein LOC105665410 [Ceratitis capitata]|uniref:(Mediterranean fruit fly) hypothetical protein n=1 Tax=Ceratitis capitata TaxID=7213 RepID=W8BY42_CERCA|nr:uncharacterized protein LOC105665410 [Ceratitis capitata]CAD6997372.1 unnamed protein product [Ceratitis capitata]
MYKFTLAFCAVLLWQCTWGQVDTMDDFSGESEIEGRTNFDDDLRELVEFFRLQMPCGYEPAGIPPLAPLKASYREFQFTTDRADISGNVTNLNVEGLDVFDVRELHFNNVLHKVRYDFNFPEIFFTGLYKTDIITKLFGPAVHVFGDGKLNLTLKNLRLYGSFILRPKLSGGVRMIKFKINTELGDVESKLTGFMNSTLKTRLINAWIEEFISLTFNDSEEDVNAALQRWVASPVNDALDKVPVLAVLALLFGIIDGSLPQETLC